MRKVIKPIGTREGTLGDVVFKQYDTLGEMLEAFGEATVLNLAQRAYGQDCERVAREALKEEKPLEEAQALVDAYKPGIRIVKPTLKNFTELLGEFIEAECMDDVIEARRLYKSDSENGLELAFNYLTEKKIDGALAA